ncbi:MAG TPA: hypothetical protein VFJ52_10640 [Terriglobia bacterium]|nr:hypothetical protein [Terriglobia bacterium]
MRPHQLHEDYEDIVQEAVITVWQVTEKFGLPWPTRKMIQIAARGAYTSWIRSRRSRLGPPCQDEENAPPLYCSSNIELLSEERLDPEPDFAPVVVSRSFADRVARIALAAMTEKQQEVIAATIMADRDCGEAGLLLGKNRRRVRESQQAGLHKARLALQERGYYGTG